MKVITIGRSTENNDIVVNDEKVSRNHLQMVMDDNGNYSVVDLGSTNGTFVNGQRISGEVRLLPNDEVRIGQTVLPWQNYFVTSFQPSMVNHPLPPQPPKPKTWIYIVIGAVLLLLVGGGVAWKIYHDKQKEKIEQEEKDKKEQQERQLEREAYDAKVEAARLMEEAEAEARKATEKDLMEVNQLREKEALEAAEKIKQKENEVKKMQKDWQKEKDLLKKENEALIEATENARKEEEARIEAEEVQKEAEEVRVAAENTNTQEKEKAVKSEFNRLIKEVQGGGLGKKDYLQELCNLINLDASDYVYNDGKRQLIINHFESVDLAEKEKILKAVKEVIGQQEKKKN